MRKAGIKGASLWPAFVLGVVVFLTYLVYQPGLTGGFLFDDYQNLQTLGDYGGVVDFDTLKSFVLTGFSGPTGRPLSLLSFLLDDNTWPSYAPLFKITNLLIHLLVGLLVCWSTLLLLRFYQFNEQYALWVAVLSSSLWMLHPYFVSTTLYVVQRMAQLAALFMLAGLIGYLHGRMLFATSERAAYWWMTLSLGLGTLLAVLSKENGALLPLLVVAIEYCNPQAAVRRPWLWWRVAVLWLPALAVVLGLLSLINFSPDAWPSRSFTQPQRLWSECRILWEYLFHLYIPRVEGRGLFQDGYPISTGWFAPVTTLYAAITLFLLIVLAIQLRKRWPLFSLSILFFLVSHLIESTVVGLELYFEHRNYAAAVFLFLPVAQALLYLGTKTRPFVAVLVTSLVIAVPTWMTWQRSSLWSDSQQLELFWASSTPESPRAHNALAAFLFSQGRVQEANEELENASVMLPDSALLTIRLLLQKVYDNTATPDDFRKARDKLAFQPFDAQAVMGLRTLVDKVIEKSASSDYREQTFLVVDAMNGNPKYKRFPLFQRLMPYLKGRIYLAEGDAYLAYQQYCLAIPLYAETDAALMMVAELASGGEQQYALRLLPLAKTTFLKQSDASLRRSRAEYDAEFVRLEKDLRTDVAAQSKPASK